METIGSFRGVPHIHGEMLKPGYDISHTTVLR
jgi:hypothetical protein